MISPAACCLARTVSRMVSAMDSLIGAMPAGQGRPARSGTGASPRGICGSASLMPASWPWPRLPAGSQAGPAGRVMLPSSAPRMAAARSWARAASAVCRQMASKSRAWDWSQPCTSFPVLNVSSVGHC